MNDTCIINKESHSLRERDLRLKLFGKPEVNKVPKTVVEEAEGRQQRRKHAMETQSSEYLYKPKASTTGIAEVQGKEIKKLAKNQEQKMGEFIDEMRQNYLQAQNANQVPQSLMYR
mgnify:CR=1 FL=1|jgi:uncharacterized protein with von Willebrand factor type A (vWA) domain